MDLTATDASELTGLSVRSVNPIYLHVRRRIADAQRLREGLASSGTLDVDHVVGTLVDMEFPWGVGDGN